MKSQFERRLQALEQKVNGMWEVEVPIEIDSDTNLPVYANATDAGADVIANEDIILAPGESKIVKTGIKVAIPEGYELQVRPRSGISAKTTLRESNSPGTVDTGYRGEVGVILYNDCFTGKPSFKSDCKVCHVDGKSSGVDAKDGSIVINKGDRIAQVVLIKVCKAIFKVVPDVSTIGENRGGGFGHTGVKGN